MATITEDYVSFETAKLLKEKGFHEVCKCQYGRHGDIGWTSSNNGNITTFARPTLQMAMKWLREKGIYITIVYGDYPSLNKVFYTPQIDSLEGFDLPIDFYKEYDKYEEAEEAGIKYALENLI